MSRRIPFNRRLLPGIIALVIVFAFSGRTGLTQKVQAPATPTATPLASPVPSANPLVIPLPEIATATVQLNQSIRTLSERVVTDEFLNQREQEVKELNETINKRAEATELAIRSGAAFTDLQQSLRDWNGFNQQIGGMSDRLTRRATELENEIKSFKSEEERWKSTSEALNNEGTPQELLDQTSKSAADIQATLTILQQRLDRVVTMQQTVAPPALVVATEIDHLRKAIAQSQRSLLEVDSPGLWEVQFGARVEDSLTRRLLQGGYTEDFSRVKAFLVEKRDALVIALVMSIGLLGFFARVSRATKTQTFDKRSLILRRPISLSLLLFIVAIIPMLYNAPLSVIGIANMMGVVPVIRLLSPQLTRSHQRILVTLIVSVLLFHLIKFMQFSAWVKRDLLALLTVGVIGIFIWLLRQKSSDSERPNRIFSLPQIASYVAMLLLGVAVLANIFGYVRLSDLLTRGTLVSAYRTLALYTVYLVGTTLISFALESQATRRLAIFRTGSERVSSRLNFALGLAILFVWAHSTLTLFAIKDDVYRAIDSLMTTQIKIGSAGFAVGNVVSFVLTLFFGYLVASIIRAVLGEEILPRFKLARGVPNAVATVSYYIALVLIFLLALAASGVELSKFAVLTGAFGVGIGFGLQNVVNNFVSGLILLFERPIRVGDFLEIGGISGEVTKIGFRSSTLHAFDGSDLIIPNATLISERVNNWTLTGTRRQILLNIHVPYGNDPNAIMELLKSTAENDPNVLDYPKPTALFAGFGDNKLNFEVRFWAPRPEVVGELRSSVVLSIANALHEAGIEGPISKSASNTTKPSKPA